MVIVYDYVKTACGFLKNGISSAKSGIYHDLVSNLMCVIPELTPLHLGHIQITIFVV